MKKLCVLLIVFFAACVQADEINDLLSLSKRTTSGIVEETFSGVPIVSFAPQPKIEKEFVPTPYKGATDMPLLSATNVFGQQVSFPYVTHFPYFFVSVNILTNAVITVTETIQLVVSPEEANRTINRTFWCT